MVWRRGSVAGCSACFFFWESWLDCFCVCCCASCCACCWVAPSSIACCSICCCWALSCCSCWLILLRFFWFGFAGLLRLTEIRNGPFDPAPKPSVIRSYAWRAVVSVGSAPTSS